MQPSLRTFTAPVRAGFCTPQLALRLLPVKGFSASSLTDFRRKEENAIKKILMLCAAATMFIVGNGAYAAPELVAHTAGGSLSGAGTYDWWYGCSPTSAGMLLGQYDRNGYSNLVPGGNAEINTFGNPGALVNSAIASSGHIHDFYGNLSPSAGYLFANDDVSQPFHSFDSLADFMGTSQDAYENSNGSTTFYFYDDNSPLTAADIYSYGPSYYNRDGMYGIGEYTKYAGYDATVLYSQYIYGFGGKSAGFTYAQYKAEIDAGRGVLIQVQTHTMYGYGYIDGTNTIKVYDTWAPAGSNPGTMTWGGSYASLGQFGVTVLGGLTPIPEPAFVQMGALLGMSGLGFLRLRRKT